MTTIAWDGMTLAGDSRVSHGDIVLPERMRKVIIGTKGHIAAIAGAVDMQCEVFFDWVKNGCQGDPVFPKADSTFILVTPGGVVQELTKHENVSKVNHWGYYAWGSGRNFALGALSNGCTAVKAVETGIKFDPYSGGRITAFTLAKFQ